MKKILLIIMCLFIFTGCIKEEPVNIKYIKSFDKYKNLYRDNIKSIKKVRYTEGGDQSEEYTTEEDIDKIFNSISSIKLGKETNMTCEDNTTVYIFYLKDGSETFVEIECDWVIVNSKRYLIVK